MKRDYQVGIIGAGLAGLSLAIQLSRAGHDVILFEKETFPFHKLCGEYLSNESVPFLKHLGIDIGSLGVAEIDQLEITNVSGKNLSVDLPLGGIGLSRYVLDELLYQEAKRSGTVVAENTSVSDYRKSNDRFQVVTKKGEFTVDILISCYGKKSNLIKNSKESSNQYLGIKYHVELDEHPSNLISIHNFKDGYCGVCQLEGKWASVCYLSHTDNLKASGNKISNMEKSVLFQNSKIRQVFENARFVYSKPIAVSNINFDLKHLTHDNVFYCGDAAGLITPLCGNGMSMALHGSYILGSEIKSYLHGRIDFDSMKLNYQNKWKNQFSIRMKVGRKLQKLFRNEKTADLGLSILNTFPVMNKKIISWTHGKTFFETPRG